MTITSTCWTKNTDRVMATYLHCFGVTNVLTDHLYAPCTMLLQYIYPCRAILPGSPFRVNQRPCSCFCIFSIGMLCGFHPTSIMYLKQSIKEVIFATKLEICMIPARVVPQLNSEQSRAKCKLQHDDVSTTSLHFALKNTRWCRR